MNHDFSEASAHVLDILFLKYSEGIKKYRRKIKAIYRRAHLRGRASPSESGCHPAGSHTNHSALHSTTSISVFMSAVK